MTKVIFCNRLDRLKSAIKGLKEPVRYLNLVDTWESSRICAYLSQEVNSTEIPRARLLRERQDEFREQYIELIGSLNAINSSSDWWAMSFTNKDPFSTSLSRNTSHFLLVAELCRSSQSPLVVITDTTELANQVKTWGKLENVQVSIRVQDPRYFRNLLKRYTPAGPISVLFKLALISFRSRRFRPAKNLNQESTAIATHTHERSFTDQNNYKDVYFGEFVEHAAETKSNVFILALMHERPGFQLNKLKSLNSSVPVIPLESCLTMWGLLSSLFSTLKLYLQPITLKGSAKIGGLDVGYLLNEAVRNSRNSGEFFLNLHVYYCSKWLGRNLRVGRCIYPFENRAWEKMLLLGMQEALNTSGNRTAFVGYQHTSITRGHMNFMLADTEASTLPLPNFIVTTGEITKNWLEKEGNYPESTFKTGSALRQTPTALPIKNRRDQNISRVLVVLATSLTEYVNMITFMESVFSSAEGFDLRIRPHPSVMPLEAALDVLQIKNRDFFSESTQSITDDLEWADTVLYSSSTVCLEAVAIGIPVIYLDLGLHVDTDPLFSWSKFKWIASEPAQLIHAIREIEGLSDQTYDELQKQGRKYANDYLRRVTPDALATFWQN